MDPIMLRALIAFGLLFTPLAIHSPLSMAQDDTVVDVVVYGGTSGGIAAAVQVARMKATVILIEPSRHLGGLTSGGLGATDIGNKAAIGGLAREFYRRIKQHYQDDKAWVAETRAKYVANRVEDDAMWTFEPHVAEQVFQQLVREAGVRVVMSERLDLKRGVVRLQNRIESIRMESGKTFRGKRFIDATYEGDLLALAGVKYTVGREANATYDETLNGVQTRLATKHQLMPGIDPFIKPGDRRSGLLPGIDPAGPGQEGSDDRRVQAYNFRMCVTDHPANRTEFAKPRDYDEQQYELLLRNFAAGETRPPWNPILMPNRKTDANNNYGFSSDFIGQSHDWPDGDYATRERIYQRHLSYQQGLLWTLANHPRVPATIREEFGRWGNCKDEFKDNGGWSHQIYVREARRLISDYVMTQHNCQGRERIEDSVGLAAYTMDSHHVQRYVDPHGHVRNEGDVQVGGFPPYPISYRSIIPRESECSNLLVPVCLSASHIAYGSIRMEPVFMVLGQSAATAAIQSLPNDVAVQRIDVASLQKRLREDGQVLEWSRSNATGSLDLKKLAGIVVDDPQAKKEGDWTESHSLPGFVGAGYVHDNSEGRGSKSVTFTVPLPEPGKYEARMLYTPHANRASNAPLVVGHSTGSNKQKVDQRKQPEIDGIAHSLGTFAFDKTATIRISNDGADGYVVVDAVQLIEAK
jgi:hypothetical protein